jgi:hypothetical protein
LKIRRCDFCDKIFETKYPKQIKFCSHDCDIALQGKKQADMWLRHEKNCIRKQGAKAQKQRRAISSRWAADIKPEKTHSKTKIDKNNG